MRALLPAAVCFIFHFFINFFPSPSRKRGESFSGEDASTLFPSWGSLSDTMSPAAQIAWREQLLRRKVSRLAGVPTVRKYATRYTSYGRLHTWYRRPVSAETKPACRSSYAGFVAFFFRFPLAVWWKPRDQLRVEQLFFLVCQAHQSFFILNIPVLV